MTSQVRRFAVALLLGGFAVVGLGTAAEQKEKGKAVLDLHAIMNNNKGKNAISNKINAAAKSGDWDDAKVLATKFKDLGEAICKCDAPKGEKDSWEKLTKQYKEQTAAVAAAVEKKDAKATSTAVYAFNKSCKACHDSHK